MKLILVLAAILAVAFAAEIKHKIYEDSEALETREVHDTDLHPAASFYSQQYQNPGQNWNQNYINNVPAQSWVQPQYPAPAPIPSYPVQSDYVPQNYPQQVWYPPNNPTTTPASVIKNEQIYGDNGYYNYEYKLSDGTYVGEKGYYSDPNNKSEDNLVKSGFYSYKGADGKTYTVNYWADKTGYHAYGSHLPTPPPVPLAIQQALDQSAKEEAARLEAQKNKQNYYPQNQNQGYPSYQGGYQQQSGYYGK